MPIPILTRYPLVVEKRVLLVGWFREGKLDAKVSANANDENAPTVLRNAVVGGIQQSKDDVIAKPLVLASRAEFFEPGEVVGPFLIAFWCHVGKSQLMNDVTVVIGKILSQQPTNILKYERLGLNLADRAYGLWEHVSVIFIPAMFSAQ